MEGLQQKLGYTFKNPALLRQALTHRSHGHLNNERLEFLGDSILNCVVSQLLFERYGKLDEGDLSRVRSNLVKQQSLYEIAQKLELSSALLLGDGEQKSGGFRRPSILGDTLEAIFAAVFLDGGFGAAQTVISALYTPILKSVDPKTLGKDAKTLLQEHLQGRKIPLPVYSVVATHGAAHSQLFEVECSIPKLSVQVLGSGGSRRAAEQAAAKLALERALALTPPTVRRSRSKVTEPALVTQPITVGDIIAATPRSLDEAIRAGSMTVAPMTVAPMTGAPMTVAPMAVVPIGAIASESMSGEAIGGDAANELGAERAIERSTRPISARSAQ